MDLTQTVLEALDVPTLPNADSRSFLAVAEDGSQPWIDEAFSEYCTDAMEAWAGTDPVQQRMIRTRRWKLNYYHGYRPQLFDMEHDPRETMDLAADPTYVPVRDALTTRVLANWDPIHIAQEMRTRRLSKELLTRWCRTVNPPDAYRWQLRMEDNWLKERIGS